MDELELLTMVSRRAKQAVMILVVLGLWLAPKPTEGAIMAYIDHRAGEITEVITPTIESLAPDSPPPAPVKHH